MSDSLSLLIHSVIKGRYSVLIVLRYPDNNTLHSNHLNMYNLQELHFIHTGETTFVLLKVRKSLSSYKQIYCRYDSAKKPRSS